MDTSKELTKMIKGIKLGIYSADKLEEKILDDKLYNDLRELKQIFKHQLDVLYEEASISDNRISSETTDPPMMTKCMINMKYIFIKSERSIKKETIQILLMGAYQSEEFLKKHPHLDEDIKLQINEIINRYYDLIKMFNN